MEPGPSIARVELDVPYIIAVPEAADGARSVSTLIQSAGDLLLDQPGLLLFDDAALPGENIGLALGQELRTIGSIAPDRSCAAG